MDERRDVEILATVRLSRAQLCEVVQRIEGELPDRMELVMQLDRLRDEVQGWRHEAVRLEEQLSRTLRRNAQLVCRLARRADEQLPDASWD